MKLLNQEPVFYLKWFANLVIVCAAIATSLGWPINSLLFLVGSVCWGIVGVIWRESSIWSLNIFLAGVYLYGVLR